MVSRLVRLLPLAVAWQAAMWWSVNLCFYQPAADVHQQAAQALGAGYYRVHSSDYWARDGRLSLIVLGAAAFVWACRGNRRVAVMAPLSVVGWVAVDLALDRAKVSGALACVTLAVAAGVVLAGLWWLAGRAAPEHAHPGVLVVTAAIAASVAVGNYGESDSLPGVLPSSMATSALAVITTLGCALTASPTPRSPLPLAALGWLGVVMAWSSSGMKYAAPRYDPGLLGIWECIVLGLLFGAVAALSRAARRLSGYLASAAIVVCGCVAAPWVSLHGLFLLADKVLPASIRDFLTTTAGHPPVHTDDFDTDLPWAWVAILTGLLVGLPLAAIRAHELSRPAANTTSR